MNIVSSLQEDNHGKIVAIYASVHSMGVVAGPDIVRQTGVAGGLQFVIVAAVLLSGVLPLFFIQEDTELESEQES